MPTSRLQDVPVGVLEHILDYAHTWRAVELWKTGDRTLMSKLANGGIRQAALHLAMDIEEQVSLPRCFESFALTSLRCTLGRGSFASADLNAQLQRLRTSNLKELSLTGPNGVLEALFSPELVIDWTPVFPALETLELFATSVNSYQLASCALFKYLPRSLLHFSLKIPKILNTFESFDALPPNLRVLRLPNEGQVTAQTLRLGLPPSLTDLGPCFSFDACIALAEEPKLLPNLAQFPIVPIAKAAEFIDLLAQKAIPLPSNITEFYSPLAPIDTLTKILPSKLVTLTMQCEEPGITSTLLMALPHTLESFNFSVADWNAIESHHWPPNLTSVAISFDPRFGPNHFHRLPRGVKKLLQPSLPRELDVLADMAPLEHSHLLELGRAALSSKDKESWQRIKQDLLRYHSKDGIATMRYIEAVESGGLYGLPLGVTTISLMFPAQQCTVDILLPPRATAMHLDSTAIASNKNFWERLSPSLASITLTSSNVQTVIGVTDWELCKIEDPSSTGLYNSNTLTQITLNASALPGTVAILKYLPRGLRTLNLTGGSPISVAEIEHLPPNLKRLSLSVNVNGDVGSFVKALPRSLEELTFLKETIRGEHFQFLPPQLTFLSVMVVDVTVQHLREIPSSKLLKARLMLRKVTRGHLGMPEFNKLKKSLNCFTELRAQLKDATFTL